MTHILVPTDGSQGSINAAKFAGNLAKVMQAQITVLYVQRDEYLLEHSWGAGAFIGGRPEGLSTVEQIRDALEKSARETEIPGTIEALGKLDKEPAVVFHWGHPAEEIVKYARENNVDQIVMGSHGRSALQRSFLGSVSQAVANQAGCPVTIVK